MCAEPLNRTEEVRVGAREEILESVRSLDRDTFAIADVEVAMTRRGTECVESIKTHISSRMCADAPDNHGTTSADPKRVDRPLLSRR
jgi:hypothetical protein